MLWKKLLLIGDSHTQFGYSTDNQSGWVSLLSSLLQRKCDVINRGFSGYNSESLIKYLPEILEEFNSESILAVVLMIGTNDSSVYFHCSLDNYRKNLQKICSYIIDTWKLDKKKLLIISPPRIHNKMWRDEQEKWKEFFGYSNESVADYSKECVFFCAENGIQCLDFYEKMTTEFKSEKDLEGFFSDGLHLSSTGNLFLFESLKVSLLEKFIVNDEDMTENYPSWESLSKANN